MRAVLLRSAVAVCLVASLSTAARAAIITGETATASSHIALTFNRVPSNAVDDSGLSAGDDLAGTADQTHARFPPNTTMWLSTGSGFGGVDPNPTFTVDLGAVYDVTGVRVFNYNEFNEPNGPDLTGRGVQLANVLVGETAPTTPLGPITLAKAPGQSNYTGEFFDLVALTGGPVRTRFFELDIQSNWGGDNSFYGLSELQFDGTLVPEPGALCLVAVGGVLALRRRPRQVVER
jgi:hypothetical protein